jgi:hypothetical protein
MSEYSVEADKPIGTFLSFFAVWASLDTFKKYIIGGSEAGAC